MKNNRNKNKSSSLQGSPTSIPTSFYIVNGHHPSPIYKVLYSVLCDIHKSYNVLYINILIQQE